MRPIRLAVIVGSTRQGRFSEKPAAWIAKIASSMEGVEVDLLDLRDFALPFFEEPVSPSMGADSYTNEAVLKWRKAIGQADAFVMVTPEYNHSMPAVLKNALDYVFAEWNDKPVSFVSYGGAGGVRSVQQLRQVVIELQMAPIRNGVHIYGNKFFPILMGKEPWEPENDTSLTSAADAMLGQLLRWARAFKAIREENR